MKAKHSGNSFTLLLICALYLVPGLLLSSAPARAELLTKCGKYASVDVEAAGDSYKVHNNIWNGEDKSQCIKVNSANGYFTISSSRHSKPLDDAPASYAFISKGCHWGKCDRDADQAPKQVGEIREAISNWSTTPSADGVYNVAYDLWFNKTPRTTRRPGIEMMIWLAYKGDIQPLGALTEVGISIGDSKWDVWTGQHIITYVRNDPVDSVNDFDVKPFIADSVSKGYIQDDWYLVSIGAGFEIWQGGEGLTSNAFSFRVN